MPVRFSCQHCGQRLSVKSEKVGSPVRCPKCNGKQIVPNSAETAPAPPVGHKPAEQPPKPAVAVESSRAAATATKEPPPAKASPPAAEPHKPAPRETPSESPVATKELASESPSPAATSTEPPPPPLPVAAGQPAVEEPQTDEASPAEHGLPEVAVEPPAEEAAEADPYSEFAVYDEPAEWVYEEAPETPVAAAGATQRYVAVSRTVLYVQGGLLAALAILGFGFGFIAGRLSVDQTQAVPVDRPASVTGLVLYRNAEGEEVPDEQAVVLVLPVDRLPEQKMAPTGLSPTDPLLPIDHPTLRELKMLGGAMGRTDANGRYNLRVPREGEYFLLFLSEHATAQNTRPRPEDVADLGNYVLNAFDLLNGKAYGWVHRTVSDNVSVSWQFP